MCPPLHCRPYYIFRAMPLFAYSPNFGEGTLMTVQLATRSRLASALFSSCKDFKLLHCKTVFWSVSANSTVHLIHIWVVRWPNVQLDEVNTFTQAVLLPSGFLVKWDVTRLLAAASTCKWPHLTRMSGSKPWPKTFSPVILTVDLGPQFHKHNDRLACARDADWHLDLVF